MAHSAPELESALVAFVSDLIAIASENPPGLAYDDCLGRIGAELEALGIDHELVETGDEELRRHAIVAAVGETGPLLYLHGHYDVVPAFRPDQFEPRLVDGRVIGRGASDMKSGLAAIIYAAREAAAAGVRVGLVIVPDEETGGRRGSERLADLGALDGSAAGAIVAEPTWGTIWHACRGAFTLRVTVGGSAAHAGLHYEGRNAFAAAVDVVLALRDLEQELRGRKSSLTFAASHRRAAESIMLVGGVSGGGTNFNVVPDRFSFTIDRRPNPEEDFEEAKGELLAVLAGAQERHGDVAWEVLQDARSAVTPAESAFVQTVAAAVGSVTGAAPSVTCCPGVLETRIYNRLGVPAVAFGPGLIDQMHQPDEYVPIENLAAAVSIYVQVARRLAADS